MGRHPRPPFAVLLKWGLVRCRAGECHNDEQICGGEMAEKEKQSGPCAVERGRKEEMKRKYGLIR